MTHNSIIKRLQDYPEIIADLEEEYYQNQLDKRAVSEAIAFWNAQRELVIAEDSSLRNEAMRKAYKVKLQNESVDYINLMTKLRKAEARERRSLIRLERHKREFEVLKLEKQGGF